MKRSISASLLTAGCCIFAAIGFHSTGLPLLAAAEDGKVAFEKRCTGCHALDRDKDGPHLRGVFGRPAGGVPSFLYSQGLQNSGVVWDSATLEKWLTDPDRFIPE